MRRLGMSEEKIRILREYDWNIFKSERRFREHSAIWSGNNLEEEIQSPGTDDSKEIQECRDAAFPDPENGFFRELDTTGKEILCLKINGYETREISAIIGITEKAIYRRMDRIKEKFKKYQMQRGKSTLFDGYIM